MLWDTCFSFLETAQHTCSTRNTEVSVLLCSHQQLALPGLEMFASLVESLV